jgi:hypothetical protein
MINQAYNDQDPGYTSRLVLEWRGDSGYHLSEFVVHEDAQWGDVLYLMGQFLEGVGYVGVRAAMAEADLGPTEAASDADLQQQYDKYSQMELPFEDVQ